MREQRVSGVPGPFSSLQSLPPAFMMRSKPSAYYLIVAANSSSSSSAGKCQPDRLSVRKRDERRESNESPSLFHTTCGQPKPHSEAHRDTIGAWQPDRTACCARTGHGWGRQWWPAIRTSNGHLGWLRLARPISRVPDLRRAQTLAPHPRSTIPQPLRR